ncbi:MAG TPA: DUF5667 domain-containing protein [Candidatus Paceibacterota bacterium]|nr:DUF5667 domain-containing protein [Candidatus Paceibacterota bacterium]
MNHRFINFIRGLREAKLSDASFARIRDALASYADLHTVPNGALSHTPILSPLASFFRMKGTLYAGALVLVVMVAGGGAATGAERAVPGDVLYALKINVNEKVAATLADTPMEKAELSAKLATRRADEAIALLAEGRLDETTASYLDAQVAQNVEASSVAAATLESEGDIAASLMVRTDLEEELTKRAASLAPPAAEAADTATMMMAAKAAPADPGTQLAEGLRAQAHRVAEARNHTAANILPGIADVGAELSAPAADTAGSATLMLDAGTTTEEMPVRAKIAPTPSNAWPQEGEANRALWLPEGN